MAKNLKSASKKTPLVSVVMSVYNGEKYLRESIESILNQTFTDFEFIIINDGSIDNTLKIIKSYKDERIVLISRKNRGLVSSLNEGITKARGTYIARQDDDDISAPSRLEKQTKLLTNNSNLVLIGSSIEVINETSQIVSKHLVLTGDDELRAELCIRSPFAHGSTVYKKDAAIATGMYCNVQWPAEDYDLWVRLAHYGKLANINAPLYKYRLNSSGISSLNAESQDKKKREIALCARRTVSFKFPNRKHQLIMLKEYMSSADFYHRKRVERLVSNYLTVPQSVTSKALYVLNIAASAYFWLYIINVALVKARFKSTSEPV